MKKRIKELNNEVKQLREEIYKRNIEIKTIQGKKIIREEFNRDWSKFRLVTTYFNRPSYIVISSQGKNTRIGDFLCEKERLELFKKIS
jgi:uncharacterized membrane protein